MKRLYLDIETIPAGEDKLEQLKYLYEKKKGKFKKKKTEDSEEFITFEEFVEKTGTDGAFGRIVCIGYAIDDKPAEALEGDEREMLEKFWSIAANADLFIGHNIRDFDLPFIVQRSMVLGVKPTWIRFEEPG